MKTKIDSIPKPLRDKVSKRITGIALLVISVSMKVILFYKALGIKISDPGTAKDVSSSLLWVALALLGVDATQKIFKK